MDTNQQCSKHIKLKICRFIEGNYKLHNRGAYSSKGLEHMPTNHGVKGSNPSLPTTSLKGSF